MSEKATAIEFGLPQVVELHAINQARRKRGEPPIGPEVQELIHRLTAGGVSPGTKPQRRKGGAALDPRLLTQAKVLWDKGWARVLAEAGIAQYDRFEDYAASLPDIPEFPTTWDARFPHLVLVDKRPFLRPERPLALTAACTLLNVRYDGDDGTLVPYDPKAIHLTPVYWMRCQDGRAYRNRKPNDCRQEWSARGDEASAAAFEGLSLYAQHPDLLEVGTAWDLPASVHSENRGYCAYLGRWSDDGVGLYWGWGDDANPNYGSVSRGDCVR